jgi:hypothetical protein
LGGRWKWCGKVTEGSVDPSLLSSVAAFPRLTSGVSSRSTQESLRLNGTGGF